MELSGTLDVIAGSSVGVTCSVEGSKPEADIMWALDGTNATPDGLQQDTTNPQDSRLTDSTSTLTLRDLSWDHHAAVLSCRAVIPPDSTEATVTVTLDVKGKT